MSAKYTREVSRAKPILFLFLLDQSLSMEEGFAGQPIKKKEQLAKAINLWLRNMCVKATKEGGVRDFIYVGVIGYRTDDRGESIIESAFQGVLGEDAYVPISKVYANPLRVDSVTHSYYDNARGEEREKSTKVPVWVDPVAAGGTPMCGVLEYAHQVIDHWINGMNHGDCHPPIVVHITDGESGDGKPRSHAEAIRRLATDDGETLVFNCHLSNAAADQILFPSSFEVLPAGGDGDANLARELFEMSSPLPEPMFQRAITEGLELQPNAKGMVFNADMVALLQFLDMGTRVALR